MPNVDWPSIRQEYEQGFSQRSLALKYSVSQAAISKKANKEKWVITPVITPSPKVVSDNQEIDTSNIPALVEAALRNLAKLDPENFLTLNEHKLFADALNQYNKIKLTLPQEDQSSSYLDLREFLASCTPEELTVVNPVIKAVAARKQEQDDKVKPIRRLG